MSKAKRTRKPLTVNLYRTKWLIAHNALFELAHANRNSKAPLLPEEKRIYTRYKKYLRELKDAPAIAKRPT